MLLPPCAVRDSMPTFDSFMAERARADPQGLLLPPLFARIANRSGAQHYPGCALQQDCYCKVAGLTSQAGGQQAVVCAAAVPANTCFCTSRIKPCCA
jgi:hypothetical protein